MPKTLINKYHSFILRENDIWLSWQVLSMKTKAVSHRVKQGTNNLFGFGILPPNFTHYLWAFFLAYCVHCSRWCF